MTTRQSSGVCAYQDCEQRIAAWYKLCRSHNEAKDKREIDECPKCEQYKDSNYPLCRNCNASARNQGSARQGKYEPESNPKWEAADQEGDVFFVYILKLDGGKFYAGHTRELRERMGEHRDGKTKSTVGKNPRLVWFDVVDTREEAADGESQLKELIDKNEREVRRMVRAFQDLVSEVDTESNSNDTVHTARNDAAKTGYRRPKYGSRRQTT